MLYKITYAFTKKEMEAVHEFVTKARKSMEDSEGRNDDLWQGLRQIESGIQHSKDYYWGNDKVSIYKDNT